MITYKLISNCPLFDIEVYGETDKDNLSADLLRVAKSFEEMKNVCSAITESAEEKCSAEKRHFVVNSAKGALNSEISGE